MKACCEAGVEGVMAAYNEIDGVYCHANRELLQDVLRGQLADTPGSYKSHGPLAGAVLGNLLGNVIARPQFIAWGEGKKTPLVRLCEWMEPMKVRWTVRPADDRIQLEGEYDAIIFEYETPPAYYR